MTIEDNWLDIIPKLEDETLEQHRITFGAQMQLFGEIDLSKVGYSQQTIPVRSSWFDGGKKQVPVRFTLFRNEEGLLICIDASYLDGDVQKVWYILTHPDHLRQGHGTRISDFVVSQRQQEIGGVFPYEVALRDIPMTPSSAGLTNKYVRAKLDSTP